MPTLPRPTEPWCELCDLARATCPHARPGDQLVARVNADPVPVNLVVWRVYFDSANYRRGWTDLPEDPLVDCDDDHTAPDGWLCEPCRKQVRRLLNLVPALLYDLNLAATRQSVFVEGGTRTTADDVSPLPYDEAASRAIRTLKKLMKAGDLAEAARNARHLARFQPHLRHPRVRDWSYQLSRAVRAGLRVIERPEPSVYYGPCPQCADDLYGPRDWPVVSCECSYQKPADDHRKDALALGEDRWLTVGELVGAITSAGETVTRNQIGSWIRTRGLPREQANRPIWRDGALVERQLWVYRLGDVRELAARKPRNDPDAA
jgi:hypothetical protein